MYLLYADESGSPNADHFTLGGLAVHEQDAYPLARAVDSLFAELPAPYRARSFTPSKYDKARDAGRGSPSRGEND